MVLHLCNVLFFESCFPGKFLEVSCGFYGSTVDVAFSILVELGGRTSHKTLIKTKSSSNLLSKGKVIGCSTFRDHLAKGLRGLVPDSSMYGSHTP